MLFYSLLKRIYTSIILVSLFVGNSLFAYAQHTLIGNFQELAHQTIRLYGYDGFDTYLIDSVKADKKGVFRLSYAAKDYGMAYLKAKDEKAFTIVIYGEDISLQGKNFAYPESIKIIESKENLILEQYANEHVRREQVLSAWDYLVKIYELDPLFSKQVQTQKNIEKERQRIQKEDEDFLEHLPQKNYVSWYLPVRKLVSSVSTVAQYRTEEIPKTINSFRKINYLDSRLSKSGLLASVIESQFWLIENSGVSLDSVYMEMNISIDYIIENLVVDEIKLNKISEHLFKFLEKRSLFGASEYLAIKLLNEVGCTIDSDFASQLESYRAMKIGNIAPDIVCKEDVLTMGQVFNKLSDIQSDYTVVVFGASWCPMCPEELSKIAHLYTNWKKNGVEVIFVSLDEDKQLFKKFASIFPFISVCDCLKWNSPIVADYHVFATPTIYLLDNKREIILRPSSVSQLDAWVDWYLVKKNK